MWVRWKESILSQEKKWYMCTSESLTENDFSLLILIMSVSHIRCGFPWIRKIPMYIVQYFCSFKDSLGVLFPLCAAKHFNTVTLTTSKKIYNLIIKCQGYCQGKCSILVKNVFVGRINMRVCTHSLWWPCLDVLGLFVRWSLIIVSVL